MKPTVKAPKGVTFYFGALVALGCFSFQTWAGPIADFGMGLDDAISQIDSSREDMDSMRAGADRSDAQVISEYYRVNEQRFLMQPLAAKIPAIRDSIDSYVKSTLDTIDGNSGVFLSPTPRTTEVDFRTCMNQEGRKEFEDSAEVGSEIAAFRNQVSNVGSGRRSTRSSVGGTLYGVNRQMRTLDKGLKSAWSKCCAGANVDEAKAKTDKTTYCNNVGNKLDQIQKGTERDLAALSPDLGVMPDPIRNSGLSAFELAIVLRSHWARARLDGMFDRRDLSNSADQQEAFFSQFKTSCEVAREQEQERTRPLDFLKSLKPQLDLALCEGLSSYMVANKSRNAAKMTLAGVGTLGQSGLINCAPETLAALDASLESYTQHNVATVDQVAAAQHLAKYRVAVPLYSDVSAITLPDGSLVGNGFALSGSSANTGLLARQNSTAVVAQRPTTVAQNGRYAPSRELPSVGRRIASNSGVEMVQGVRRLSSKISLGQSSSQNARALKSGAQKTRKFFNAANSHNDKVGRNVVKTARAASAKKAKTAAGNVAQAKYTRALVKNNLSRFATVRGRGTGAETFRGPNVGMGSGNTTSGTAKAPLPTAGRGKVVSINEQKQANNKIRQEQIKTGKIILNQIDWLVGKANATLAGIRKLVQKRDQLSMTTRSRLNDGDVNPDEQQNIFEKYLSDIEKIDNEIAPMGLAYDMYTPAIVEQKSMLSTLSGFQNLNLGKMPSGTVPVNFPKGMQTQVPVSERAVMNSLSPANILQVVLNIFNPISNAVASKDKVPDEIWWSMEWERFMNDYEAYSKDKDAAYQNAVKAGWTAYRQEMELVHKDQATYLPAELIESSKLFVETIDEEAADLLMKRQNGKELDSVSSGNFLFELREARDEARLAREEILKYQKSLAQNYPESADANAELWWGQLPTMLLQ